MTIRPLKSNTNKLILIGLLPFILFLLWHYLNPFSICLSEIRLSTGTLSAAQKQNITQAIQRLDGTIIRPGALFSFNQTVGPRTSRRNYIAAPAYLGGDTPDSIGGGICLVSSAIYDLALNSGLSIIERIPHLRTIHSVLPGLDASVWYGQADLKFKNTLNQPLQIRINANTSEHPGQIVFQLRGKEVLSEIHIQRKVLHLTPQTLQVRVERTKVNNAHTVHNEHISTDVYQMPNR